jgi:hypothetical protein
VNPHPPRYVSPEKAAQERAQMRKRIMWAVLMVLLFFFFIVFGYSDQAPAAVREIAMGLDRAMGQPVLSLIAALFSR